MLILEQRATPFKYCILADVFDLHTANSLLALFEYTNQWTLVKKSFYEHYDFLFNNLLFPDDCNLLSDSQLRPIREMIQSAFAVELEDRVEISAHKMISGHGIGIHSDSVPGWETHRFTVTLGRDPQGDNGGYLILFGSRDVNDVHRVLKPVHNIGVAFELTSNAFHAVSDVTAGVRYSVVYSFWSRAPN